MSPNPPRPRPPVALYRAPAAGPLWGSASASSDRYPTLEDDISVEVAVIGGGIAGASVARELVASGHDVVLLEGARVGGGATGHSTGKVSVLQGDRFSGLERELGRRTASSYAESQLLAMDHLEGIVERVGIECSLRRRPAYLFAESSDDLEALQAELASGRRAGLNLRFTLAPGLPFPTAGAARLGDQIELDPLAYVRGLVDDLARHGGAVYENTLVVDLEEGAPHILVTRTGRRVRAEHVVVTTLFPVFDRALLFPRLHPRRKFVLAGALPAGTADLDGMYVSVGPDVRTVRTTVRDGRNVLLVSGAPFEPGEQSSPERLADLRAWADTRFGNLTWSTEWAAQDNDTPDLLPFIGPLHPFGHSIWVATGFGGWGLSNGVLAGILLRDLIEGREPAHASIFHTRRLAPVPEAESPVPGSTRTVDSLIGRRAGAHGSKVDDIADVQPERAAYLSDAGSWAAYRDEQGSRHVVSAACTHMGCLVAFNNAERAWECRCHGSRFSIDGEVLQGPATAPLEAHPTLHDGDVARAGRERR